MSALDLVVFDMIGTTVQASDKIPQAFVTAFEGEGIHLASGDVSSIRGKSKREAICELASILIEKLRWDELVDSLVCNDDACRGRPAPDLILGAMRRLQLVDTARVASVGDTISDLEAGANAGTGWNIGVFSGAHSRSQLNMVAHTALIDSVADLPALFSQSGR